MKGITGLLRTIIAIIAWFVFGCGIVLAGIGAYEFMVVFTHLGGEAHHTRSLMIIGLLHAVDLFLIAIVFFVMSLGFFILFSDPETQLPVRQPEWLRIKNFTQLKIILSEAILTTLVVLWLASLVERADQIRYPRRAIIPLCTWCRTADLHQFVPPKKRRALKDDQISFPCKGPQQASLNAASPFSHTHVRIIHSTSHYHSSLHRAP